MYFEIIGKIENVEIIAVGGSIRDIMRLRKQYGSGRWRKLKGKPVSKSAMLTPSIPGLPLFFFTSSKPMLKYSVEQSLSKSLGSSIN